MGGGTGTGGIPVAAEIAKGEGVLTVAVVTKPFSFEGPKRMKRAVEGLERLRDKVDTLIVIPNDRLLEIVEESTPLNQAFEKVDRVLYHAVKGIVDIVTRVGLVNVDFADVKTVMKDSGSAVMGMGIAEGEDRGVKAAKAALFSPLLDGMHIRGARWILVSVVAGPDLTLHEIQKATEFVLSEATEDGVEPELILGVAQDPALQGKIQLTVIATGIDKSERKIKREVRSRTRDNLGIPAFIRKGSKGQLGELFEDR
jgi:cell division protein FtsZ